MSFYAKPSNSFLAVSSRLFHISVSFLVSSPKVKVGSDSFRGFLLAFMKRK